MRRLSSTLARAGLLFAAVAACGPLACASSNTASPTTNPSEVASLDLSPALVAVRKGDAKKLKVIATMGDGTKKDVTGEVQWVSENPQTATVDGNGTIVGAGIGVTTIRATYKDTKGSVKVTVAP